MQEGESTLNPPKIVVICIIFLQLIFLVMYGHNILDYFCFLKYIWLHLDFIKSIILKNSTNIEEIERMEDIRDKIIPIIEFENLNIYFKTKVVDGFLGEFFYGVRYWYTLVKSMTI